MPRLPATEYQIKLALADGSPAHRFTREQIDRLTYTRTVNGVASHELAIDITLTDRSDLFEEDGQIEVWRKPAGGSWYLDYEGFHRGGGRYEVGKDGERLFTSTGVGYVDLLARRRVAAYAGSSETAKSGAAETVLKAFVLEQAGASAAADRRITQLSIEADGADGETVSIQRSYRGLLEVCQEIAAIGGGDFDVVGTGANTYELRWYAGQRGTDRRTTVVFSTEYGNMGSPKLARKPAVGNAVLVAGQGEGDARTWVWRPALLPTGMNRREVYRDARDSDTTAVLQARGDEELRSLRAVDELTFEVLQTPASVYGTHYGWGDLVTAQFLGLSLELQITSVTVTVQGDDETIRLGFESIA
jgi:hypothetical protein